MRNLETQITRYAAYHRDRRNIATHFVGIPLIVFSVALALTPVGMTLGATRLSMGLIVTVIGAAYYLMLDAKLGLAMTAYLACNYWLACEVSAILSTGNVHWSALGIFVFGWMLQFLGHKYEGMKPAFFDDIMGLAIGPLFVMTEIFFLFGLKPDLQRYVESHVGSTLAARNGTPIGPSRP